MNTFWGWVPMVTLFALALLWFSDQILDWMAGKYLFGTIASAGLISMLGVGLVGVCISWLRYMQAWPFVVQ